MNWAPVSGRFLYYSFDRCMSLSLPFVIWISATSLFITSIFSTSPDAIISRALSQSVFMGVSRAGHHAVAYDQDTDNGVNPHDIEARTLYLWQVSRRVYLFIISHIMFLNCVLRALPLFFSPSYLVTGTSAQSSSIL